MLSHQLYTVIWLLNGVIALYAYPTINLPFLFGKYLTCELFNILFEDWCENKCLMCVEDTNIYII